MTLFRDRVEAGQLLADALQDYAEREDVLLFALPRGGVPVAYEVAKLLKLPLDVFLVRKLGVPGYEELAMGAIAMGDASVFNESIIKDLRITDDDIAAVMRLEQQELDRRNALYRENRPLPDMSNKTVILIDDGIATGATIRAAIKGIKQLGCKYLIVATPVAPPSTCELLRQEADEVLCLQMPEPFYAIGSWYQDFSQTSDEEVRQLLSRAVGRDKNE